MKKKAQAPAPQTPDQKIAELVASVREMAINTLKKAGKTDAHIAELQAHSRVFDPTIPRNKRIPGSLGGQQAHCAGRALYCITAAQKAWNEGQPHAAVINAWQAGLLMGEVQAKLADVPARVKGSTMTADSKNKNLRALYPKMREAWASIIPQQQKPSVLRDLLAEKYEIDRDEKTIRKVLKDPEFHRVGS